MLLHTLLDTRLQSGDLNVVPYLFDDPLDAKEDVEDAGECEYDELPRPLPFH